MKSRLIIQSCWRLIVAASILAPWQLVADEPVNFSRDIRPILSNNCFKCHGFDDQQRQAGLRLDVREAALAKLESGATAIVAGERSKSELARRITAVDGDERMPPVDSGKSLSAAQIELLQRWIDQGATYDRHWSFVAPQRPELPKVNDVQWPVNGVDYFVLSRMEQAGLRPATQASRESLIRRVAFDLTGLPPTLDEIDEFVADQSDRAYEKMADRYLKSPAYAEHMTRHWLDLARYADTNGYQYDTERQMWVWRDWVVNAYDKNMPFDQFTVEQLAGDLLPDATSHQKLATGFNRNHGITIEGGVIDEEYRTEYVMDRAVTTGTVWLGLTVGCARCHNHKFDPITQTEFYQFFAYFNQVPEQGNSGFTPNLQVASPLADSQAKEFEDRLAALRASAQEAENTIDEEVGAWAQKLASSPQGGWTILVPESMKSSGNSKLEKLADHSILAGGANPNHDVYEITSRTDQTKITVVRLEALTDPSLPGGGPGRHDNSNFVLSEFELVAVSASDATKSQPVKFSKATADYSQNGYDISNTIDGSVAGNNGWAVDGPTRKEPCTALFFAAEPFGFEGGTELRFQLRHEAGFTTHGIGRPRFSVTTDDPAHVNFGGVPADIVRIAAIPANDRSKDDLAALKKYFLEQRLSTRQRIESQIAQLEQQKSAAFPATMIMQDMPNPRKTFVLNRGQYDAPTVEVNPGVPSVFPQPPGDAAGNRLTMARWLVNPNHPLTARVAVNRYWQRMFGVGLVKTNEDFGTQGEYPSHPELLDWLAAEFVRSGWDIKAMQRLIVTSATYRQTSSVDRALYIRDPENRLLARGPRLRLEAEEVRDNALAVGGLLVHKLGGQSVYPYQPDGLWLELNNRPGYSTEYKQSTGDDLYRRSMYTFWKRTIPSPMMTTFDAPEREVCTVQRSRTNTPLQSLLILNGPQFVEAARHLGERMMRASGQSVDDRIVLGFRLATSRRPTESEIGIIRGIYEKRLAEFRQDEAAAMKLLRVGDSPRDPSLDVPEHAAWTTIGRLLLNLDEAITKG